MAAWHYEQNGQQHGPVTDERLKELAASGEISPDNRVWKQGMEQWERAGAIKGLFPKDSKTATMPPPMPPPVPETTQDETSYPQKARMVITSWLQAFSARFSLVRVAMLLASCLAIVLLGWMLWVGGASIYHWSSPRGKVLIVTFLDANEADESFGLTAFQHALRYGGQVAVTTKDVESLLQTTAVFGDHAQDTRYVVMSPDGRFYPKGSLANYITSQGWAFHSQSMAVQYVFVRN